MMTGAIDQMWMPTEHQVEEFRGEVFGWFATSGRDLPWRRTRDPYAILVSEVMLQQTQVSRVLPYYRGFVAAFPTVAALADAPTASALRQWQGLGYNRRAVNLRRSATVIINDHKGVFPSSLTELQRLPGVGKYTARAVACFAFEANVAVVETNVRKALRYLCRRCGGPAEDNVDYLAEIVLPDAEPWTWNQAMIDFGALRVPALPESRTIKPGVGARAPSPAFTTTDRYWRGRIVAALCRLPGSVPTKRLIRELPAGGDEYRIRTLLEGLRAEGMVCVEADEDRVSLPE